jgi:polysaccharide export outer membrane protein
MDFKKGVLLVLLCVSVLSCRSKKNVVYFQNEDALLSQKAFNYEPTIQVDDVLSIRVVALDPETVASFNTENSSTGGIIQRALMGYLVDSNGFIEFPVLGKLKAAGLTKTAFTQQLKERLTLHVTNPTINIRILNFKVTVLGEVGSPGTYEFDTERVTLLQLFSKAGDLTFQSKRKNILIVREVDGIKTFNRVDATQAEIVGSPFYYLAQNDVVYVEPRKNKIDSGAIPPALTNTISVFTVLLTTLLLVRTLK